MLRHVVDSHPDHAIKQTAADVRILIATHGRVTASSCESMSMDSAPIPPFMHASDDSCVKEADAGAESKRTPLIEVISSREDSVTEQISSQSKPSVFQIAMREVADVLVPVRGHALLTLRRLVDSGDTETLDSVNGLLAVCEKTVDDSDSYVYLNTIQLLASLAAKLPQQTLPWLADKYLAGSRSQDPDVECRHSTAERRMKLGEVLVKTSSALGMHENMYDNMII